MEISEPDAKSNLIAGRLQRDELSINSVPPRFPDNGFNYSAKKTIAQGMMDIALLTSISAPKVQWIITPFCTTRQLECITTRIPPGCHPTVGKRYNPRLPSFTLVYPLFDPTSSPHSLPLRNTMAEPRKILIPYPTPAIYTCPICRLEFNQAQLN